LRGEPRLLPAPRLRGRARGSYARRRPASVDDAAVTPPKRFPDRDTVAAVRAEAEQLEAGGEGTEERRLAGRVMALLDMGELTYLDLVDLSGCLKLLCPVERSG